MLSSPDATRPAASLSTNLLGHPQSELEALMVEFGERPFRGRQLFAALHQRRQQRFADISCLSKPLRQRLTECCSLARPRIDAVQASTDGTRKYRFIAPDGGVFESVYIPEVAKERKTNTLCVSSQTGCAVGCKFCFTATLRRNRDLDAAEILGQVLAVMDDVAPLGEAARISNIVFMGMGEPLLNYEQVVRAARVLVDPLGPGFSTRRVTISTAGIVPRIYDIGKDLRTQLAISLNATTDRVRNEIMPINRKWPLASLTQAMRDYPLPARRRITVEYVLLGGVNDSLEDARRLPRLLAGIPVKINLLPLNAHERTALRPPLPGRVEQFQDVLRKAGLNAIVRTARGQDISAACGQLGPSQTLSSHQPPPQRRG